MTFGEIASRFEQPFGNASQVEFSSLTRETDESLEQSADRVIETAQRALGQEFLGMFYRNRPFFVLLLVDNPPLSLDEAVRRVKT